MSEDSYEISLGNFDTETRRRSNLDQVLFWDEQAKNFHGLTSGQKPLSGIHRLLNGLLVVRSTLLIIPWTYIKLPEQKNLQSTGWGRMVKPEQ